VTCARNWRLLLAAQADKSLFIQLVRVLRVKGRSSFQLLQSIDMGQERPPIVFYAFDLLQLNGKDLHNLPIQERKAKLEELLKKPQGVIRSLSEKTLKS
jgi:ATP-dependent DNA ligase